MKKRRLFQYVEKVTRTRYDDSTFTFSTSFAANVATNLYFIRIDAPYIIRIMETFSLSLLLFQKLLLMYFHH